MHGMFLFGWGSKVGHNWIKGVVTILRGGGPKQTLIMATETKEALLQRLKVS